MGSRIRIGRLKRQLNALNICPGVCPHSSVTRFVVDGRLLPSDRPCPCGFPQNILLLIFDTVESFGGFEFGELERLMSAESSILVGVKFGQL